MQRASRATPRCNRFSKPPASRTSSRVFAFVSAPVDTPPSVLGSLTSNQLCGIKETRYVPPSLSDVLANNDAFEGTYTTEGITKLCEALKGSAVTSLKCAATQ